MSKIDECWRSVCRISYDCILKLLARQRKRKEQDIQRARDVFAVSVSIRGRALSRAGDVFVARVANRLGS